MYLLDTNVISEAAPSKKVASADLRHWMDANRDRLFLSVITIAGIVGRDLEGKTRGARGKSRTAGRMAGDARVSLRGADIAG
ncbi:PIN domain-containing protein [Komagataeibacter europaeus]|uniref:hypothetical protein n=1 Tax=Komagataeibacter europaeus TaxID=33995 RepID=UPI000B1DF737|nr:hypothetical protein [Komagataeibacter europaeus]